MIMLARKLLRPVKAAVVKILCPPRYFNLASIDIETLLPGPPPEDSDTLKKEFKLILLQQDSRTPEDVERSRHEAENLNVYLFDNVFDTGFNPTNLPLTQFLFFNVDKNVNPLVDALKMHWRRPRPYDLDHRIQPSVNRPAGSSYPSGHAVTSWLDALILSQMMPDLEDRFIARARQIGDDRFLSGVHFPGDIEAGRSLARTLFPKLMTSVVFHEDLARAKLELAAFRDMP